MATLEGEQDLFFFTEFYYPENLPLSFVVGSFSLFSDFMRVNACLQAEGQQGIHPIKGRKERATPYNKREREIRWMKRAHGKQLKICTLSTVKVAKLWRIIIKSPIVYLYFNYK